MRKQGRTIFLMLLCSIVFLSGCQAESRQGKGESGEKTEGQEIYCSNIGLLTAELYRKAEEVKNQFLRAFSERRRDTFDCEQIYADYEWDREKDARNLLYYYSQVVKEYQDTKPEEWKELRYQFFQYDGDKIPELILEKPECWVKIYTVTDGSVSLLLEEDINKDFDDIMKEHDISGNWSMPRKKLPEFRKDQDAEWISAYREVIEKFYTSERKETFDWLNYELIYLDEDDVPELIIGENSWKSIYTMKNGSVSVVLDYVQLSYALRYLPKQGILRVENGEGVKSCTTFWKMNEQNRLEEWLREEYYDDYDKESGQEYEQWMYYCENQEISESEYQSYRIKGDFVAADNEKKLYEYIFDFEE